MTVTCSNCGENFDDPSLKFCTSCGTRLQAAAAESAPVPSEIPPSTLFHSPPAVSEESHEVEVQPAPVEVVAAVAPAPAQAETPIIRRSRTSPFLPPRLSDEDDTPLISRGWAAARSAQPKGQLTRQRKMAGNLPDWEPLPPGELLVKRTKRK